MNVQEMKNQVSLGSYPDTQIYDPETLKPLNRQTQDRVDFLRHFVPEMFQHRESFLDIGCARGFLCHLLCGNYKRIVGLEKDKRLHGFAHGVKGLHDHNNIKFINKDLRGLDSFSGKGLSFNTVFVGNVHHYFFNDAVRYGVDEWAWLKKIRDMAEELLIIDGPVETNDPAVKGCIAETNWSAAQQAMYTEQRFVEEMTPEFSLVRSRKNQAGVRSTLVFRRAAPIIKKLRIEDIDLTKDKIEQCRTNKNRGKYSIIKCGDIRLKIDAQELSDNIYGMLNYFSRYFPRHTAKVYHGGKYLGDVVKWIGGNTVKSYGDLLPHWLRFNNNLSAVGLFEPQFTLADYKVSGECIYDIDVDTIRHFSALTLRYIETLYEGLNLIQLEVDFEQILKNLEKPDTFFKAIGGGCAEKKQNDL